MLVTAPSSIKPILHCCFRCELLSSIDALDLFRRGILGPSRTNARDLCATTSRGHNAIGWQMRHATTYGSTGFLVMISLGRAPVSVVLMAPLHMDLWARRSWGWMHISNRRGTIGIDHTTRAWQEGTISLDSSQADEKHKWRVNSEEVVTNQGA